MHERSGRNPIVLLFLIVFGCSEPEPTSQSPQPAVEIEPWIELWQSEPHAFVRKSGTLSETEKMLVVRTIIRTPDLPRMPLLCSILSNKDQQYCNDMLSRAHLWEITIPKEPEGEKPTHAKICPQNDEWCLIRTANSLISNGGVKPSVKLCERIATNVGKEECFFQIAENSSQIPSNPISASFELCQSAPHYIEHCQAHVIEGIASSTRSTGTALNAIQAWSKSNESLINSPVDYFYTLRSMQFPNDTTLPVVHRASVQTFSFLMEQKKVSRSLDEWIVHFVGRKNSTRPFNTVDLSMPIINYWVDSQTTNNYYLSLETRPTSSNLETDLRLAMLAALLQLQFPMHKIHLPALSEIEQWMVIRSPTNQWKNQHR